ncbi:MAG TPA: hypothetical protein VFJ52_05235, partial [Terriglobia bacterium]|nr:hypothetical protein [Terriglobia bacterium]
FSRGYSESEAIPPVPWIGYQNRASVRKDRGVKQFDNRRGGNRGLGGTIPLFVHGSAGTAVIFQYIPS